jgi:translocation and assembly module TamB
MTRPLRIARNIAIAVAALILVLAVAAILIVRSQWFQNYVKQTIVTSVEDSTGGRVEIGTFRFDWTSLSAVATNFVIHGTEPAASPPLLSVARVQVDLRLFASLHHLYDITYLGIQRPEANVILYPDGRTNVPTPRQKSNADPLQTVVDLAIGRFELTNGLLALAAQKHELNVRGNNLRAQLSFNTLTQQYRGQVSLQPLYVVSGRDTPVNFTVAVPLVISRNRIDVNAANIFSRASAITLSASLENLKNPQLSGRVSGHIALADLKNAANLPLAMNARNVPSVIDLDASASNANNTIYVSALHLTLGHSNFQASGSLNSGLHVESNLALGELGRLMKEPALPDQTATLNATAKLDSQNKLTLTGLQASALGAEFSGDASLQNFPAYQLRGDLHHLDIATALGALGASKLPYNGVVSGPVELAGNLDTGVRSVVARARLAIAPGSRGIPVSGNLTAAYSGARDDVSIERSVLTLPHSRLSVNGSVGKKLNVALTTTNLDDLLAAVPPGSRPDIALHRGSAGFTGTVTGSLSAPDISGHLTATRFSIEGREFDSFAADATTNQHGVAIENGSLRRSTMQARFSGTLGLRDWKPLPSSPLQAAASMQNADLADLLALAGESPSGYSGQLSVNASIHGTFGNPQGSASLLAMKGTIQSQPFDRAEAQVNLTDQLVTVPTAFVQLGPGRVNLTAEYRHPRDSFAMGQLRASVASNRIDLTQLAALQKQQPNTAGIVQIDANVSGNVSGAFQLTSVDGNASIRGLQWRGQNYGDLTANAATSAQTVNYTLTSNFAGSHIQVKGNTELAPDYPTTASAQLANLPIERVLAVANRSDIPVKGILSGAANFNGTIANPQGSADLTLANGTIYDDSVNRVQTRVNVGLRSIDIPQLELVSGSNRLELSATYDHPAGNLESGNLQLRLSTNNINLACIKTLRQERPGLGGTVETNLTAAAQVQAPQPQGTPRVVLRDMNGNMKATGLAMNGKNLGDLSLAASTSGGRTNFTLASNIAGATIEGHGNVQLARDYPTDAQVKFQNITWAGVRPLVSSLGNEGHNIDAAADGQISVTGPLTNTQQLDGSFQVTRFQLSGAPSFFHNASHLVLQNQGPIVATLNRGALQIASAHLTGPQTDFRATGTIPFNGSSMDVALNGNVNLAILQQLEQGVTSSGSIVLAAGVRGSVANPRLTGQVELHNASFDSSTWPNGIWNANGVVALRGNSAVVQNLTAQSGGGQVTITGSANFTDQLRFDLEASASRVRIMPQQGLGIVVSARASLAGTSASSTISGTVTIDDISYASRTDLGSLLSLAAPPVQTPSAPSPLLANMRLDVRVRSSSALGVQSTLAQNLQLSADLRVRGTAANPGILGRVQITEGKLLFFGSTYTVNTGTISFYNPVRIDPVLDLSLQTATQGVTVVLKVNGSIDNMKLSYTSDPPLPFQQIVNLLATGATPTTDPTLLANQPAMPAQSFQQMGESAIVGQALANPVANQLQRVFGVTQLKINPAFAAGSQLPETQLSLQQQISNNITFTYVTGLNTANAETIQVLWTFTPQWSAQALRDYNGIFSVTLMYKRQFR